MASKRDQLHAYQFMVQRVVSALVTRETDPEQPPFRRPSTAAFGGIAISVVALAAVGVYGMISPGGNDSWQDGKSVIVEEETGTRYVYLDERLHPVDNYTSALLAINQKAKTVTVSRNSLVDVRRGPRIGIPDAPDALPDTGKLLNGGWTLCSQPSADTTGAVSPRSVLMVGEEPATGLPMTREAVLASVPETKETFLVYKGYRHQIANGDVPVVSVGLRPTPAARVSPAVIEAIPKGRPLAPIAIPAAGTVSTAVPSRADILVGQLFRVTTAGGAQYYLAEPTQLRKITELQYDIQRAYPPTATAYPGGQKPSGLQLGLIEASTANQAPIGPGAVGDAPTTAPEFADTADDTTMCLTFAPGTTLPKVTLEPKMPAIDSVAAATPERTDGGVALADQVNVPPGHAAVIESMTSAHAPMGTLMIVTDMGVAHPLASPEVLRILGYDGVKPVRIPAGLVARIPMGSGLSHEAAMQR